MAVLGPDVRGPAVEDRDRVLGVPEAPPGRAVPRPADVLLCGVLGEDGLEERGERHASPVLHALLVLGGNLPRRVTHRHDHVDFDAVEVDEDPLDLRVRGQAQRLAADDGGAAATAYVGGDALPGPAAGVRGPAPRLGALGEVEDRQEELLALCLPAVGQLHAVASRGPRCCSAAHPAGRTSRSSGAPRAAQRAARSSGSSQAWIGRDGYGGAWWPLSGYRVDTRRGGSLRQQPCRSGSRPSRGPGSPRPGRARPPGRRPCSSSRRTPASRRAAPAPCARCPRWGTARRRRRPRRASVAPGCSPAARPCSG